MIAAVPRWTWYVLGIVIAILFIVGLGFMIPDEKTERAKAAPAEVEGGRIVEVTLRGFDNCSDEVDLALGPAEGKNYFLGPPDTLVRWLDYGNEEGPITKWWGPKGGRICFLGPSGETVTVRQVSN